MLRVAMLLLAGVFIGGSARADEPPTKPETGAPGQPQTAAPAKPETPAAAKPETPTAAKTAGPPKSDGAAPVKSKSVTPAPRSRTYTAARQLPPGLPRAGYGYRTTVAPPTPYRAPVVIEGDESLISPAYGPGSYLANLPGTPILPGSTTIPGYYGRAFDYDYQGPYYGGPYVSYYWRLPYACGVYGYC